MRVGVWECLCSSQMHFTELQPCKFLPFPRHFQRDLDILPIFPLPPLAPSAAVDEAPRRCLSPSCSSRQSTTSRSRLARSSASRSHARCRAAYRTTPGSSRPASTWPTTAGMVTAPVGYLASSPPPSSPSERWPSPASPSSPSSSRLLRPGFFPLRGVLPHTSPRWHFTTSTFRSCTARPTSARTSPS